MSTNKENLEGLVSKLKEQGINAGNNEKNRIIESAKEEADKIISDAEKQAYEIIEEASQKAKKLEETSRASITQASRDVVEATRLAVIGFLKTVFRKQTDSLFNNRQYSQELLKAVIEMLPGNKSISISEDIMSEMESFLLKQALSDKIVLKPLEENAAKIIVESEGDRNIQFVLSSQDIEESLFFLLNKDLVEQIKKGQEEIS